jgi:beta-lactam-binding protein with PASTA domain
MDEEEQLVEQRDPREDDRRRDRQGWVWFPIVVVLVILLILMLLPRGFWGTASQGGGTQPGAGPTVKVPNVVGLSLAEAVPRLSVASLRLVTDASPTASPDIVLITAQSPAEGAELPSNGAIHVTISQPEPSPPSEDASFTATGGSTGHTAQVRVPRYLTVPDVMGMTSARAESAARAAGLTPYVLLRPTGDAARRGHVFQQQPAAGSRAIVNSELLITVGMGG